MDIGKQVQQERSKNVSWWILCLHVFTSVVLIVFLLILFLKWFGYESYHILSGSMEPTLIVGEVVLVNRNDCDVDVGEIIAFQVGEHIVVHRIMKEISDGVYITKGDANPSEDICPVEQWQILGTVWMKLGRITPIWLIFTSKCGAMVAVGLIILHVMSEVPKRRGKEVRYV